ncbi:hypothetical protein [Halobacillus seohaensis]|uniref:Histidine kinase N-terminal 7TM region domain-containing protein n=1 Tax=Halobacillus seohaensis TaxID=447421 RepID=A0ABW2EMD0_9BACI
MGFTLFFFVAWLIVAVFIIIKETLSITENTFVFLIILIININWSWIMYEELKLVKVTESPIDYTAFLLFRSIIIPMVIVVQLNLIERTKIFAKKFLVSIGSLSLLLLLTAANVFLDITSWVNWNLAYDALYFVVLHIIAVYLTKFYRKTSSSEVNYS